VNRLMDLKQKEPPEPVWRKDPDGFRVKPPRKGRSERRHALEKVPGENGNRKRIDAYQGKGGKGNGDLRSAHGNKAAGEAIKWESVNGNGHPYCASARFRPLKGRKERFGAVTQ